ncbi:MAG: monovalent cation/H+ antiporter complex subunit F [Candidatus Omnitrophica bacterium]|nr:monovalent cation/H+ antiporter complex subunit F [Candidatus Omnitrophota bacterium]
MRRLRWLIGAILIIAAFLFIAFYPVFSILEWQSGWLEKAFFILIFCGIFCAWRLLIGPTAADRAVALDIFGILILGFCAILGVPTGRDWYIDIGIAWALQSFISILAIGKYMEGRGFDE